MMTFCFTLFLFASVALVESAQFVATADTCQSTFIGAPSCAVDSTCAANVAVATIDETLTEAPIVISASPVFGNNKLHLIVSHPSVAGRTLTNIDLSSKADCNYPGSLWVKTVDASMPCNDVYTLEIDWTEAYIEGGDQDTNGCGLVRSTTSSTVSFDGVALISYVEQLPDIDGTAVADRQVAQVARFQLDMPAQISSITGAVSVQADASLATAVTTQTFDVATGTVTLRVLVSSAAPLRTINAATVNVKPTDTTVVASGSIDNSGCGTDGTATCHQIYQFDITRQNSLCDIDGTYTFEFDMDCQSGVAVQDCPGALGTTLTVTVVLDSEDLCAETSAAIAVSTSLDSFAAFDNNAASWAFTTARDFFSQSDTLFFELVVSSTQLFPIESITLNTIDLDDPAVNIFTAPSTHDAAWAFVQLQKSTNTDTATTHNVAFQFTPAASVYGTVVRNSPVVSTLTVVIDILFTNNERKRVAEQFSALPSTQTAASRTLLIVPDEMLVAATEQVPFATPLDDVFSTTTIDQDDDMDTETTTGKARKAAAPSIGHSPIAVACAALAIIISTI